MKVGYERINSNPYGLERVIDSRIDRLEDVMTRLSELKAQHAEDSSVISVFYAIEKDDTRYKIVYIENMVEPEPEPGPT